MKILNDDITGATHVDRKLVSGDSPKACDDLGEMVANALLDELAVPEEASSGSRQPSATRSANA